MYEIQNTDKYTCMEMEYIDVYSSFCFNIQFIFTNVYFCAGTFFEWRIIVIAKAAPNKKTEKKKRKKNL